MHLSIIQGGNHATISVDTCFSVCSLFCYLNVAPVFGFDNCGKKIVSAYVAVGKVGQAWQDIYIVPSDKEFILNQVKAAGPAMVDGFFLQEETIGGGHHVKYTYQGSDPCEINVNPGIPFSPGSKVYIYWTSSLLADFFISGYLIDPN